MGWEQIVYDVEDRIATVTLNRPEKLNAWTRVMDREVREAMAQAAQDEGVRVIVLTGAGRGFCAGADMDLLAGISGRGAAGGDEARQPPPAPAAGTRPTSCGSAASPTACPPRPTRRGLTRSTPSTNTLTC